VRCLGPHLLSACSKTVDTLCSMKLCKSCMTNAVTLRRSQLCVQLKHSTVQQWLGQGAPFCENITRSACKRDKMP
jgi:hypothetical protein